MYVIAVHPTLSNDVFAILDDKMEEKALLRVGLEPLYFNPGDLPIEPSQQSRVSCYHFTPVASYF